MVKKLIKKDENDIIIFNPFYNINLIIINFFYNMFNINIIKLHN